MKVLHSQLKFIMTILLVLLFVRESSSQIITSNRVIGETITDGVLSLSQGALSNVVSISSPPGVNLVFSESFGVNGQVQTPSTNFQTLQANNVATASITAASLTSKTSLTTNTLLVSGEATASGPSVVSQAKLTGDLSVGGNVNVVKQAFLEGKVVATNLDATDLVVRTGVTLGENLNVTKSAILANVDSYSLNSLKITASLLNADSGTAVSSKADMLSISNAASFTDMLTVSNSTLSAEASFFAINVENSTKADMFDSNYLFVETATVVKGSSSIAGTLAVIRETRGINHSTNNLDAKSDAGFSGFVKVVDTAVSGNLRAHNSSWFGSNFSSPFLNVFNTYNTTMLTVKAVTGVAGNLEVQDSASHMNNLEVQATGFFAEVLVAKNFTSGTLFVANNSTSGPTQVFNLTVVDNINVANMTDVNSLPRLVSTRIESTTLTSAFGQVNTFEATEQTKLWGNVTLLPSPFTGKADLSVYLNSTFTKVSQFSGPLVLVENYLSANDSIINDLQVDTFFDTHTAQGYAATLQNLTVYGRATLNIIEVKKYVDSNLLVIGTVTSDAFFGPVGVFGSTITKETEVTRLSTIDDLQTDTAMANYAVVQDFDALSSRVELFNTNVLGNAEFLNLNVTTLLWANSSVLSSVDLVGGLTTGPLSVTDSSTINGFFYSASASVFGGDTVISDLTVIKAFTTNTLTATFKISMNDNSAAHPFRVTTASGAVPFYLFREGSAIIGWSGSSENTFHGLTSFETLEAGIPRFNTIDGCLTCPNSNLVVGLGANDVDGTLKLWNPLNGDDILVVETSAGVNVLNVTNNGLFHLVSPLIQFKVDTFSVQKGSYPRPIDSFFDVYSINPDPLSPTRLAGLSIGNDGGMEITGNLLQLDGITLVENVDSFVVSPQGFFGFVSPDIVANPLQVISDEPSSGFPSISIIRNWDIIFDTNNVLDYVGQPNQFLAPPLTNGLNNAPTAYAFRLKTDPNTFTMNAVYMRGHLHLTSVEHFISRVTTPATVDFGDNFMFYYVTVPAPTLNIGRWTLETLTVNLAGVLAQDVGKVIILFGVEGIEINGFAPILQLTATGGTIAGASNLYLDSGVNSIFSAPADPHAACNLNIKADVFAHTFIVTGATTLEILGLSAANVDPGNSC